MPADRLTSLRHDGQIEPDGTGGLRFHGAASRLFEHLRTAMGEMSRAAGAASIAGPPAVARDVLARASYFDAFADSAFAVLGDASAVVPPAACYHAYPVWAGRTLAAPQMVTVEVRCGRREAAADAGLGRLERFHMREVVFAGPAVWVAGQRDAWLDRLRTFASALGLACVVQEATDTFFGDAGRGRKLMQQLKKLKYELVAEAGSAGALAIASCNLHETFFTSRFAIGPMADGRPAYSGCAAAGLERWTLACLAQLDAASIDAILEGGVPRSTMNT